MCRLWLIHVVLKIFSYDGLRSTYALWLPCDESKVAGSPRLELLVFADLDRKQVAAWKITTHHVDRSSSAPSHAISLHHQWSFNSGSRSYVGSKANIGRLIHPVEAAQKALCEPVGLPLSCF